MKFLTLQEADDWWHTKCPALPDWTQRPRQSGANSLPFQIREPSGGRAYAWARGIVQWLWSHRPQSVLIVVREHGIWDASENLHLYYVWRRSCHDFSLLEDAPGHLFLDHEHEDCVTLVYLALLFGWGIMCGVSVGKAVYVDHDGHAALYFEDGGHLPEAQRLAEL